MKNEKTQTRKNLKQPRWFHPALSTSAWRAGTGKSLIGRALAEYLTKLYKKHNIQLQDVICWPKKVIPSEPKISCHSAGEGKKIVLREKLKHAKKVFLQRLGIRRLPPSPC